MLSAEAVKSISMLFIGAIPGAILGIAGKVWYDRHQKKERQAALRQTVLAESEALCLEAKRQLETKLARRFDSLLLHLERVVSLYDQPDFVSLVADDTWARAYMLKRLARLKSIQSQIQESPQSVSDICLEILSDDGFLQAFGDLDRWRRFPRGTRFTRHLTGRTIPIRWYHFRRKRKIQRILAEKNAAKREVEAAVNTEAT